jgi:hypothetical protein
MIGVQLAIDAGLLAFGFGVIWRAGWDLWRS